MLPPLALVKARAVCVLAFFAAMGVLGTGCAGWSTVALGLQGQRAPLRPARLVSKSGSQGKKRSWDFGDGEDLRAPGAICSRFRWEAGGEPNAGVRPPRAAVRISRQAFGSRALSLLQGSEESAAHTSDLLGRALSCPAVRPLVRSEAGPSRGKVIQSERSRCQV